MKHLICIAFILLLLCQLNAAILPSLTWVPGSKQTVTLSVNEDYDHALVYAIGKVWMALNTSPAKMVRFNDPMDLNNRTTLTFANDTFHNLTRDLIYVPSKGKLYMSFLNGTWLSVSEIDPVTLAYTDVIRTNNAVLSHSMCVTDTHFFLTATSTTNTAVLIKFALSNWAESGRVSFAPLNAAGAPRYDGTNIYVIGGEFTQGWVAKVDPSTLSFTTTNLLAQENFVGDNQSFEGGNVWVPLFNSYSDTNVLRVQKSDLAITRINTGLPYSCYTLFSEPPYMWRALGSAPGIIQRINTSTLAMANMVLDPGEDIPSDIVSDGVHLFIGLDTSPAKLIRLIPQSLGPPSNLTVSGGLNVGGNLSFQ